MRKCKVCNHPKHENGEGFDESTCPKNIYVHGYNSEVGKEQRMTYPCTCEGEN